MKAKLILSATVLSLLLLVGSCQGAGSFTGPNCLDGTCVRLDAAPQADGVGSIVPATVIVESQVEVPELYVTLETLPGFADVVGERLWTVQVKPTQPVTRTGAIRPKSEGYVQVVAAIVWKDTRRAQTSINLNVTMSGVTPRPQVHPPNVITLPSGGTRLIPSPPPPGAKPKVPTWPPGGSTAFPAIVTPPIATPAISTYSLPAFRAL